MPKIPQKADPTNPTARPGGQIGLWAAMAIGIGGMVGAGIFSILGVVAQAAGSAMWLSFLIGGANVSYMIARDGQLPRFFSRQLWHGSTE
jgi:amino acid transporter